VLKKQPIPGNGQIRVTFILPYTTRAERVSVLGDFNGWDATATPMIQRRPDANWVAVVELEAGRCYRFRYLLDGKQWLNDWYADGFEDNSFGTNDSVVDLTR